MNLEKQKIRSLFSNKTSHFVEKIRKQNQFNYQIQSISHRLENFHWSEKTVIATYYPLKEEVDLRLYTKEKEREYLFTYPCVEENQELFKFVHPHTLFKKSKHGFFEPESQNICPLKDIDVFLIPSLALDRRGCRLGRGRGFYDKILNQTPQALKIGIAWDVQIESKGFLPCEEHDVLMDVIVTPQWILFFNSYFKNKIFKKGRNEAC